MRWSMKENESDVRLTEALDNQRNAHPGDAVGVECAVEKIKDEVFTREEHIKALSTRLRILCHEYKIAHADESVYKDGILQRVHVTIELISKRMGIGRSRFELDLNASRYSESNKKIYYIRRRKYLQLYALFFTVSPRYLMGLTEDRFDYGDDMFDPMVIMSNAVVFCYNKIIDKLLEIKSIYCENNYHSVIRILQKITTVAKSENFEMIHTMLRSIPAVNVVTGERYKRYCKEIEDVRVYDSRREGVAEDIGFNLIRELDIIWEKDKRIIFILTAIIEAEKWELLDAVLTVIAEGGKKGM